MRYQNGTSHEDEGGLPLSLIAPPGNEKKRRGTAGRSKTIGPSSDREFSKGAWYLVEEEYDTENEGKTHP